MNEICKRSVVWHLTDANKGAFCVDHDVFVSDCIFKSQRRKFVVADKFFEGEIVGVLDVGASKHEIEKRLIAEEFVKQRADMHALAITAQNEGILKRRVGVADDAYVFARVERAVAKRAVTYAVSDQFVLARNADFARFYARCENDRFALVFVVIGG